MAAVLRFMTGTSTSVDGTHVGRVVDAYLEAVENGFGFHDMLRAVRELSGWLDGSWRVVV